MIGRTKGKIFQNRISIKLALGEHLRKLEEVKAKRANQDAVNARQEKLDASTIAKNNALAEKAMRGDTLTPYQQQQIDLQNRKLDLLTEKENNKPAPQTEGEKTVAREQAKVDVKKALELPQAEQNVNMISSALAENGPLDRLEKAKEIGDMGITGKMGARKFLSANEGVLGELS